MSFIWCLKSRIALHLKPQKLFPLPGKQKFLNYKSHHPLHQKLGVIRTLYDRKDNLVTEEADKDQEEQKVQTALQLCGYRQWTFKKVKDQRNLPKTKRVTKKKDDQHRCKG